MAAIDKTKEQIGWLKVTFALLVAIDASLISWLVQNFSQVNNILLFITAITLGLLNLSLIHI